MKEHSSSLSI